MKKIIFTVAAVATFGFSQAQDIKIGAKAGVNFANLTSDYNGGIYNSSDNNVTVGFHVGGLVEIKLTERFAIQPELLFSLQGAKIKGSNFDDGDGNSNTYENKVNLGYVNVPVMVKFYPIPKLFVEAGPQIGFLATAKSKEDLVVVAGNERTSVSRTVDVKNNYKSVDFGFNVGVGYEFTENLFVNARYNIGLSDIDDTPAKVDEINYDFGVFGSAFKTKNSVLSLSLGFKF